MKLSTRARYALRMILDVARNDGEQEPVSLAGVAGRTDLSRGYLEQLALALRNAQLLKGVTGRKGGYLLALPAAEITVAQVIEAAIGPVLLVDCLEDPASCPRAAVCECRALYRLVNRRVTEVLQEYTLADLLDSTWVRSHLEPVQDGSGVLDQLGGAACGCGRSPRLREPARSPRAVRVAVSRVRPGSRARSRTRSGGRGGTLASARARLWVATVSRDELRGRQRERVREITARGAGARPSSGR